MEETTCSLRICTFMSSDLKDFGVLEFCIRGIYFQTVLKVFLKHALLLFPLASYVPALGREWISIVPKGNYMLISEALYIFVERIK